MQHVNEDDKELVYSWDSEKILEIIVKEREVTEKNWRKEDLPKLVNKIIENYETVKGMEHLEGKDLPSKEVIIDVLKDLLTIIFPGYFGSTKVTESNMKHYLNKTLSSVYSHLSEGIEKSLVYVCRRLETCPENFCHLRAQTVTKEILEKIPEIRELLRDDIQSAYDGDPAAKSINEVILSYPCVLAIATYRIAHELYIRLVPVIPRIMSEYAHSETGIDIHPGAKIGRNFFIDHGTGVVIGETAEIGDNVKIYQGVTLGALSFPKDEKGQIIKGVKRHPTVGNNVVIYSGATLLGAEANIGDGAVIGGNVWITSAIPPGTKVTIIQPDLKLKDVNSQNRSIRSKE
jgi:serine O-acetyltransferase